MTRPVSAIARLLTPAQKRFRRSRPGSVLILVVALLVLMSLIGIAYVTSARVDRYSAKQNTFNTEVDLLLQALVQLTQRNITAAGGAPTDTPGGADDSRIWTSAQDSTWMGDRVPVLLAGNVPGWRYVAVSQTGTPFESPYSATGAPIQYTTRENLAPTFVNVPMGSGYLAYPAFYDASTGQTYLAASAAGDGIADAPLFRLPVGELDGITYYGAARIIDNNSAINASTADQPDATGHPQQYFPSGTNLLGLLVSGATSATQQLIDLDAWRFHGSPAASNLWSMPVADNGTALPPYTFSSEGDALWSQLGRRLGNPGLNSNGAPYRALSMVDAASLARRFSLADPGTNGSVLEAALAGTLISNVRTVPYTASQAAAWYAANFNYDGGAGNRRPITTVRNTVSNIAASRMVKKGSYDATKDYTFGDWVLYPNDGTTGRSYVCVLDIDHTKNAVPPQGDAKNSALCWAAQPWVQYPLKTPVNTGTFGQLWLAYWGAMCDTTNTPPSASVNAMFRNPIRSAVTANPASPAGLTGTIVVKSTGGDDTSAIEAAIASSAPGATLSFSGSYNISHQITFATGRTYSGGGGGSAIAALTPDETLKLRAAVAAINTLQLRSNKNDILSRTFSMGGAVQIAPGSDGAATFVSTGGGYSTYVGPGAGPTVFQGITFSGGQGILLMGADGLTIQHCTLKDSGRIQIYGLSNSHIDHNTFNSTTSFTVAGYPNDHVTVDDNKWDLSFITDPGDWAPNPQEEAMHLTAACDGLSVSHNTVLGVHLRWGIELQLGMTNLKIQDNYIHTTTGCGFSCATGGDPTPPWGNQGENIDIGGNVFVADAGNVTPSCAVEIMGDKNVVIHDNYFSGFGSAILNGTGGQANQGLITTNNVLISYGGPYADGDNTPWPTPQRHSSGDQVFHVGDGGAPPPPAIPASDEATPLAPTGATALLSYRVTLYGSAPQPYITEVYANNDLSTNGGYVAIEMYNPYNVTIPLRNWQLATIDRAAATTQLNLTLLSKGLEAAVPTGKILPHQRLIITDAGTTANPTAISPPVGMTQSPTQSRTSPDLQPPVYAIIPELTKAFNQELVILRPRRTDGTLSTSLDPTNLYDETQQISDMAPVDSYDFTSLTSTPTSDQSVEWHYIRPNDTNANMAWHWIYPSKYQSTPTTAADPAKPVAVPRLVGTQFNYYIAASGPDLSSLGKPDGAAAVTDGSYHDMPLEVNNTGLGANLPSGMDVPKNTSQYPFGGFARNADILQTTFVGSYRIDLITINAKTQKEQAQIVEINPLSMDSASADDQIDTNNAAENLGRFAPMHPGDSGGVYDDFSSDSAGWSAYHFAMRLFDFVTVHAPHDDYMPNTDPAIAMGAFPVPNANAAVPNATAAGYTEDNIGIDGLININTAPWRVLASLPISNAETVAKAIVLYRDGDGTNANPPHGPFTSIFQLNDVPNFRTSFQPTDTTAFEVSNDYQTQFLTLGQISSLITTRSDTFTAYLIVQGWRGIGTTKPELVVQRRAAFLADRSMMSPRTPALVTRNVPVN